MYDPEEIRRKPVCEYQAARPSFQSGDLLFASGDFFLSRVIRRASHSMWSHVGIIYRVPFPTDRVLVLESVEVFGVRLAPLSKYMQNYWNGRPYPGPVYIARCGQGITHDVFSKIFQVGCDLLTRDYGYVDLVRIVKRIVFGSRFVPTRKQYICSELVDVCFRNAGIRFTQKDQFISPEDIARDENVEFRCRLK